MKTGDRVQVNATISGKPVVEGMATIVRVLPGGRAMVVFDEDGREARPVERWIEEG